MEEEKKYYEDKFHEIMDGLIKFLKDEKIKIELRKLSAVRFAALSVYMTASTKFESDRMYEQAIDLLADSKGQDETIRLSLSN